MSTQAKTKPYVYLIMIIAGIGGILYGFDLGIVNGALLFIKKNIPMTPEQESFIVASVLGGGALATLISGPLSDRMGRLFMMLLSSVIFLIGVYVTMVADFYSTLLTGRLIQGVGIGIVSIICPLYLSESIPARLRGRGVGMFQVLTTVGIVVASLVGDYFTEHGGDWRGMLGSALVPGVLFLVCLWFIPKSPRWLVMRDRGEKAKKVLEKTMQKHEADESYAEIVNSMQGEATILTGLKLMFKKKYLFVVLLVLAFAALNQLTGINVYLQYSAVFMKDAGSANNLMAMVDSTWITVLNLIVTVIAISFIDRVGRKPLLTIGSAGVAVSLLFSGIIFYALPSGVFRAYMFMGGMFGMIIFFAMGPGAVIYLAISELLPTSIRSSGMSVALTLNALVSSILAAVALPIGAALGMGSLFLLTGALTVIYWYLAAFKMPETKGKSLEEIQQQLVAR